MKLHIGIKYKGEERRKKDREESNHASLSLLFLPLPRTLQEKPIISNLVSSLFCSQKRRETCVEIREKSTKETESSFFVCVFVLVFCLLVLPSCLSDRFETELSN